MTEGEEQRNLDREKRCRYLLSLPRELYDQIEKEADERGTTVANLMRQFIRLGIEIERSLARGGKVIKIEGGKETELVFF